MYVMKIGVNRRRIFKFICDIIINVFISDIVVIMNLLNL